MAIFIFSISLPNAQSLTGLLFGPVLALVETSFSSLFKFSC
jgi:hypothetical protein